MLGLEPAFRKSSRAIAVTTAARYAEHAHDAVEIAELTADQKSPPSLIMANMIMMA